MRFDEYSREASLRRRRAQRSSARRRRTAGLLALALAGALAVGGTVAWLTSEGGTVTNTFEAAKVETTIVEGNEGAVKKNVKITNVQTDQAVDVYVRAKVVVNWVELGEDGRTVKSVSAQVPAAETDYTAQSDWGTAEGWVQGSDGFWYWTSRVKPGESTGELIGSLSQLEGATVPDGCSLSVEILSEAIQADGVRTVDGEEVSAVEDAWKVVKIGSDGKTLEKKTA